jgi:hypothetical protein
MEVPNPYFPKPQVPSVIRMKSNETKNKVSKSQVPIKCLTLKENTRTKCF